MSEDSQERVNSSNTNSSFESLDPDAHSKLIEEKIAIASERLPAEKKGLLGALLSRFEFFTKFFGSRADKADNLRLDTKAYDGGQMVANTADADKALTDSLKKKLGQSGPL